MLLVVMHYCEYSCFIIPAVVAFTLDRTLPSSRRSRDGMHHININQRHAYLKTKTERAQRRTGKGVLLFERDQDDSDKSDATKNLVDKLTAEQRQTLLQREMNSESENSNDNENDNAGKAERRKQRNDRRNLLINGAAAALSVVTAVTATNLYTQTVYTPPGFQRFSSTKFIAATGDPTANQGIIGNAQEEQWGVWNQDPGPRGVFLRDYQTSLLLNNKQQQQQSTSTSNNDDSIVAPAGWKFDKNDWWLEEHGTYSYTRCMHTF
jgi:hypothetical protein